MLFFWWTSGEIRHITGISRKQVADYSSDFYFYLYIFLKLTDNLDNRVKGKTNQAGFYSIYFIRKWVVNVLSLICGSGTIKRTAKSLNVNICCLLNQGNQSIIHGFSDFKKQTYSKGNPVWPKLITLQGGVFLLA